MADPPDTAAPKPHSTPPWVKAFGLIAIAVVVVVVVVILIGGGEHGPGRHLPGGGNPGGHTAPAEHSS